MTLTAGAVSQVSVGATVAKVTSAAATGGTGPYTYQWYRSTTDGFTPGGGNLVSGATALTLNDSGLLPNTIYYYKMVSTDTGHSNDTVTSAELTVTTTGAVLGQNQFAQSMIAGVVDPQFNTGTFSVLIDVSQTTPLYPSSAVKVVDSADGVPKVVGCDANADDCAGFLNYSIKDQVFTAGMAAEMSSTGNAIYLYAVGAIARFAQVQLDINGGAPNLSGVKTITGSSGAAVVGYAYDKAAAMGALIRVMLSTPGYTKA